MYKKRDYIVTAVIMTIAGWIFAGWIIGLPIGFLTGSWQLTLVAWIIGGPIIFYLLWWFFDLRNGTLFQGK